MKVSSYQHADTLFAAHAIGYVFRLAGQEPFVDTGSIGGGELYPQVISQAVADANVVLAMLGPSFAAARLHEPTSVVAFEWRRAQFHGCAVVPVVVDDGALPPDVDLPPALGWFTERNVYSLQRSSFSGDVAAGWVRGTPRSAADRDPRFDTPMVVSTTCTPSR